MKVSRPTSKAARLYINVLWKDDRDLEKPKLRKRKLSGYLVYPNGKMRRFVPKYLEVHKPSEEIIKLFEEQDFNSKAAILRGKIDRLIKEMSLDVGGENKKIDTMLNFYITNPDSLNLIGKRYKNEWKLKPEIKQMHDLNTAEVKIFQDKLNTELKKRGLIENAEQTPTE